MRPPGPGRSPYDRPMTAEQVRIGLVGYGFGGRYFHAPLLAARPGATSSGS